MKKVYLIAIFDAKTKLYKSTYLKVYNTEELARKQIEKFDNDKFLFTIVAVELAEEESHI